MLDTIPSALFKSVSRVLSDKNMKTLFFIGISTNLIKLSSEVLFYNENVKTLNSELERVKLYSI